MRLLLVVLAILCFALAAAGVSSRVNLTAAGLALWALAAVVPG